MKNARSNVLRLFAVALALSSAPTIAQTSSDVDQTVALNNPEIKKVGKGAKRKDLWGKIQEYNFILRSSPIESDAIVYIYRTNLQLQRSNDSYDILTCRTPCIFKIPAVSDFSYNVVTPPGFVQISKTVPVFWEGKLTTVVLKTDDITFSFVPQ